MGIMGTQSCGGGKRDPWYRELLEKCAALEEDYQRIFLSLPEADREKLDAYIALCEELEYRRMQIACRLLGMGRIEDS